MYLTRFQINPGRANARAILASPQAMHAAVMATLPGGHTTDEGRTLWRLDLNGPNRDLYIVSPDVPDLTGLHETAGWPTKPVTGLTRSYGPVLDKLADGQQWRFRLTANPTVSKSGERTIRPRVTVASQTEWLINHAAKAGFTAGTTDNPTFKITSAERTQFNRDQGRVTLQVVTYDGLLTVTNPAALRHTLSHGLGRARAYGCGMLTLAPAGA